MSREILQNIIEDFNPEKFVRFFREKNRSFAPRKEELNQHDDENFRNGIKLGEIKCAQDEQLVICVFQAVQPLSERSGKKAQYEKGKRMLKEANADAGIFIFYDEKACFRFSLIYPEYTGTKRQWSYFKRFTYFVSPELTNKTFLQQIGEGDFSSLQKIKEAFSVEPVTKQFYGELQYWYFWAMDKIKFPDDYKYSNDPAKDKEIRNATNLIRLITRIIFIRFLSEKGLIPPELFSSEKLGSIIKDFMKGKKATNFYNAILQNLFFGTLNQKMDERRFADERGYPANKKEYGVKNLYRYGDKFLINKDKVLALFKDIPFLNGGLFDCLDKDDESSKVIYVDGFSRNSAKQSIIPDYLFFQHEEERVDLSNYGLGASRPVRGLIEILNSYNFTIDENTPVDQEIALDPELLGKVFENLLASYNPETATTARKATGSYYTPREIVDYMVEESLFEYLKGKLSEIEEEKIRMLLSYSEEIPEFSEPERKKIISAIDDIKILDPACGSGAFPMGILHKLVHALQKLDPENRYWHELQYKKALKESEEVFKQGDKNEREERLKEINETFDEGINYPDYARKLYLIENCIYGVDIQPIAIQISKLRFFISLVLDQKVDRGKENLGIRALPNLETKFVAANTLIGLEMPQSIFYTDKIRKLEDEIKSLRHRYFQAKTRREKLDYQKKDRELRGLLAEELRGIGFSSDSSKKIATFDLYDQNASADFFEPEWMFGITSPSPLAGEGSGEGGFDVVIGNPPYGILNKKQNKAESIIVSGEELEYFKNSKYYEPATGGMLNIFRLFILRSINLLGQNGVFSEIFPLAFMCDLSISRLRKHILDNNEIISIEAFPERDNPNKRVFEAAKMSVCILNVRRSKNSSPFFIRINSDRYIDINAEKNYLTRAIIDSLDKENCTLPLTSSFETNLFLKIFSNSIRFSEIGNCSEGEVHMTFCKKSFTDNPQDTKLLKGAIIDRYQLRTKMSQGEIVYINEKIIFSLKKNLPRDFKTKERIVSQGITGVNEPSRLKMMIVKDVYCANSLNYLTLKRNLDLKYLLGIFNSKLLNFIFSKFSTNSNVNGYEVNNLPIVINSAFVQPINKIVDKILAITKSSDYLENPAKKEEVKEYEKQIDQMVYKLYGLTAEEIEIVENN